MVLVSRRPSIPVSNIAVVMALLPVGRERVTLLSTEEPMTTAAFIIALFCQVDTYLHDLPKHPHATLWPSEVVTLGLLHALKGVGNRAFSQIPPDFMVNL
jgi:hypothetical protein